MIRYALTCNKGHAFESWFQSAGAFDTLTASGHVTCPDCGTQKVSKSLMAPQVRPGRKAVIAAPPQETPLSEPQSAKETALAELRKKIETDSDYVGLNFAAEARAIHEGAVPARSIYGEAKSEDAKSLIEDGVPVAPLPFVPKARTN